jgi:hypothetical protein
VLAGWPEHLRRYVTVLGSHIDGNEATVWLLTNDRPSFEGYESVCVREDGHWHESHGSGGLGSNAPREILEAADQIRAATSDP